MAKTRLTSEQRAKRRRRRRRKITGFVFLCFALLGVAFLVSIVINQVNKLVDDSSETEMFERKIAAVVALDPAPFNALEKADTSMLLEAAIWTTWNNEDNSLYSTNDEGFTLIPLVDIEKWFHEMYGPSYTFVAETFEATGVTFVYDEATSSYVMPTTSLAGNYVPRIESITRSNNTKVLLVSYIEQTGDTLGQSEYVAKQMEYVMLRDSGGYYLYAVREPELGTQQE